jgi:MarR-like DNA-binding transcriptional regulator SgrR of sgrS sRNA
MADTTVRDQVWTFILARVRAGKEITVADVEEYTGCSERVARETLQVAAENADLLVDRHGGRGKVVYRPKVSLEPRDERT